MSTSELKPSPMPYKWYAGGAIVVIVLLVVIAITVRNDAPEVAEARLSLEASLGSPEAQVQIVEYGAYGCHTCRAIHQSQIVENLLADYGDDVQFTFRNWPVISPQNDPLAAQAAQCALDQSQEAFWQYHNALYDLSNGEYREHQAIGDFVALADKIGLDDQAIQTCLEDHTHDRTVDHWKSVGDDLNLPGTPTFFVNGQRVNSPAQLADFVQEALAS